MIIQFPTNQINTRREIQFCTKRLAELQAAGDEIAARIKQMEQDAIQGASDYYQISTEALFLFTRLQELQEALESKEESPELPFPIEQLELF